MNYCTQPSFHLTTGALSLVTGLIFWHDSSSLGSQCKDLSHNLIPWQSKMRDENSGPAEDLLAIESRQISRQANLYRQKLLASASQLNNDYYDYYDYDPGSVNSKASVAGLQANRLGGGGGRSSIQRRKGSAASNNLGSYSGNSASYSGDEYCDNGISIALLITALLGIAIMFYILYTKITKGRRRRRSTPELDILEEEMNPILAAMENFEDIVYAGMVNIKVDFPFSFLSSLFRILLLGW
jgi:hypothetical protein